MLAVASEANIQTTAGLDALIAAFLTDLDVKPASKATYSRQLRQFASWLTDTGRLPAFQARQLSRLDVLAYRDDLTASGLAALTVGGYLTAVRQLFGWLAERGQHPDIGGRVRNPKQPSTHMRDALTAEQVRAVLDSIDTTTPEGLRDYALINLLARTGLRTIEIERAAVGDIRQQGGQWVLYVQGKGRDAKDEYTVLTEAAYLPLRAYLASRGRLGAAAPLFASQSNRNTDGGLTTRSISRIVKTRFQSAGLDSERLTAHSLRHTAATLALTAGADVFQVQAMLRHADTKTTNRYVHNINRIANAAEAAIQF